MDAYDKSLIQEFKQKLPPEILKVIKRIIVFGSRARGDAESDSDLDIAVLVGRKSPETEKRLEDIVYQIMWDHDFKPIISLKVFAQSRFDEAVKKKFSFYRHIQKEGISF